MPIRSIIVTSILLSCGSVGPARAQAPVESRAVALGRLRRRLRRVPIGARIRS